MNKVNILIVEDEGIIALELQENLENEGFNVVAVVDNGRDALELVKNSDIDLALLDINIKGGWDGIETALQFSAHKKIPFIYLTAYADAQYFERAKSTMPSAYLTKPIRVSDLRKAIELAMYNFSKTAEGIAKEKLAAKRPGTEQESILYYNNTIFIKQNYKYNKIAYDDITCLKADGNYTYIQTVEKIYVVKHSLQNVLNIFNADTFVRVHRSFAINITHLTSFTENAVFVGEEEIPVGRNYKDAFLSLFKPL